MILTTKKTVTNDKSTNGVDDSTAVKSVVLEQQNHDPKMGTGSCRLCDCPGFIPASSPGRTCINRNSAGGTCNHYESEHN